MRVMTKLDRLGVPKAVIAATFGAAMAISVALVAAPAPDNGNEHAVAGSQRLVVVGEVLVVAEESPDGPGMSESALAAIPVQSRDAH
jgi:hypothetical protein